MPQFAALHESRSERSGIDSGRARSRNAAAYQPVRILSSKKPDREVGLFASPADHSAEDTGCVHDTGCRQQPSGDQKKFHDLPPRRSQYTP